MTDTTAETQVEDSTAFQGEDASADDARYAEMEAKYGDRQQGGSEAPGDGESGGSEEEKTEQKLTPLPPEEWEKRARSNSAALKEERQRRRDLEARLEALEAAKPKEETPDELLELIGALRDDDEDPISDIESVKRALKLFAQRQKAEAEAEASSRGKQTEQQRFMSTVMDFEAEFREERPDYDNAAKFLRESIQAELEVRGYSGEELQRALASELIGMTQTALKAQKNPAEIAYSLAERRGYKPGSVAKTEEKAERKEEKQPVIDTTTEKLQTLQKGQQAGRSLSAVGGKSGDGSMTLTKAANLKGKDVLKAYAVLKEQAKANGTYR